MNKYVLKYELDLDFVLLAISSPLKDYRLCHFINKHTGLKLGKAPDHEAWPANADEQASFSMYEYVNEAFEKEFYLISNKGYDGGWLVPEMKQSDYFLIIKSFIDDDDLLALEDGINAIADVLVAKKVAVEKLKSKENLIF